MKILSLSQWFLSEADKMAGLFVHKHAQAVAARISVSVVRSIGMVWSESSYWQYIKVVGIV